MPARRREPWAGVLPDFQRIAPDSSGRKFASMPFFFNDFRFPVFASISISTALLANFSPDTTRSVENSGCSGSEPGDIL